MFDVDVTPLEDESPVLLPQLDVWVPGEPAEEGYPGEQPPGLPGLVLRASVPALLANRTR